jgi:hypothetical protein
MSAVNNTNSNAGDEKTGDQAKMLWLSGFEGGCTTLAVSETEAKLSGLLVEYLSNHKGDDGKETGWRNLQLKGVNVEGNNTPWVPNAALKHVVEWLQHHQGVVPPVPPRPLPSKNMKEFGLTAWDVEFTARLWNEKSVLYSVLVAAHHLQIQPLAEILCAQVAATVKGEPLVRFKDLLKPDNDTAPQ